MKRIIILTGNHLCHNPRVLKEAMTLAAAGFAVEVLGAWSDLKLKRRDQALLDGLPYRFSPVVDITENYSRVTYRVRTKAAEIAFRFGKMASRWQFGIAASSLRQIARRRSADLFIAHSEPALFAVHDLLGAGHRVGVDMEDWFSEDLLPDARRRRPLRWLRHLEQQILRTASHSSCPSEAMSHALAAEYGCRPPTVVYNAFHWTDRTELDGLAKDRLNRPGPSVHWYSQTLGAGRGLEDLFAALPDVQHHVDIHLRGKPTAGFSDWLAAHVPATWRERIVVHSLVSNAELLSRVAEHDIGFAGEMKYSRSRDLTVTNKLLHYLLGGLAVIASDTAGQAEIAKRAPGAISLYGSGNPTALAQQLNELLANPERLARAKGAALSAAQQSLCWERQVPEFLQSVNAALT